MTQSETVLDTPFLTYPNLPPAQLWVGDYDTLVNETYIFLQQQFCPHHGCQTCTTCLQIRDKQHHATMWFYPEKAYTIELLDDLFTTISFKLDTNEHFFFILQRADYLSIACSNKLLKIMEEPPAGYHFILLAESLDTIVPTIISRCIVKRYAHNAHTQEHPLFACFTTKHVPALEFAKMLDSSSLHERESKELLDTILDYWLSVFNNSSNTQEEHTSAARIIATLKNAYTYLPMPGGIVTFWRNLYLFIQQVPLVSPIKDRHGSSN